MLMISNVHQREYPVGTEELGELLDSLASKEDRLWPKRWPPMRFDRELAAGAIGGHGPIRYSVLEYTPGRHITFGFDPKRGLLGTHVLHVLPGSTPDTSVLRHTLIGQPTGYARWRWRLVIRWLHDALLEDLLDRAATELGHPPTKPAHWSPWVRLCRRLMTGPLIGKVDNRNRAQRSEPAS
ncbi:MAG: SRPBCC family protein [Sciscionella sp.]|nr:SRPBCC family protein [Sciscionella sp.]